MHLASPTGSVHAEVSFDNMKRSFSAICWMEGSPSSHVPMARFLTRLTYCAIIKASKADERMSCAFS
jgi:hypothetical protein